MAWTPPWTLGLPQERCADCGDACVAITLVGGLCRGCRERGRRAVPAAREVREAEAWADPERLFDPPAAPEPPDLGFRTGERRWQSRD
jgi:hypothetical protein